MKISKLKVGNSISYKNFFCEYLVIKITQKQVTVIDGEGEIRHLDEDDLKNFRLLKAPESNLCLDTLHEAVKDNFQLACEDYAIAINALDNIR